MDRGGHEAAVDIEQHHRVHDRILPARSAQTSRHAAIYRVDTSIYALEFVEHEIRRRTIASCVVLSEQIHRRDSIRSLRLARKRQVKTRHRPEHGGARATARRHDQSHQRSQRLLRRLRDGGNTVIVVEHDEETIRAADHIIEIGPGPGVHGGRVVAQGPLPALAQSVYRGRAQLLQQAEEKLLAITPAPGRVKRQVTDRHQLETAVEAILSQHRVADYLHVTYQQQVEERHVRRYKERPARTETLVRYQLAVTRNETAIQTAYRTLGWRLYVTNAPTERLSLPEAVRTYRGGVPTIERDFSRFKGRPLGLRPLFVQREDHVIGLVRLLSLALRILTLMEFVIRRSLQEEQDNLVGLYPGNPTTATRKPTTERILQAFKGITLSIIDLPGQHIRHLTPLTPLQNRILQLLRFTDSTYTSLAQTPNSS